MNRNPELFSFDVSANISYDVTTDVSWLKQVVGRGMEQSTLHFSVEENTGSAMREGNIILSGNGVERTVKVMQKGKEETPYLVISQEHFNILPEGGTVRFTVKANVPYRGKYGCRLDGSGCVGKFRRNCIYGKCQRIDFFP